MKSIGKMQQNLTLKGLLQKKLQSDHHSAISHSVKDLEIVNFIIFTSYSQLFSNSSLLLEILNHRHWKKARQFIFKWFKFAKNNNHTCRFGLTNVKYGVAEIIKNFKIKPGKNMKYPLKINPLCQQLEPIGGFVLNFKKICDHEPPEVM